VNTGPPRLPAEPLLRQVELRGGLAEWGIPPGGAAEKALARARREGTVTIWTADRLAVLLGMHPLELWPRGFC
jgi:hypothetical protein